jgi:hypothetical protein
MGCGQHHGDARMSDYILDESGAGIFDESGAAIEVEGATVAIVGSSRLLEQYKQSQLLIALQDALYGKQLEAIEAAAAQLYGRLDIDTASGEQLNRAGVILGIARLGWGDDLYRILLKAKIGQNSSQGTIEDVITVWRLLAQADRIQVVETYPAQIDLYSDTPIDGSIAGFVHTLMQKVVAAGVRVDFLAIVFSPTNAFGFDPTEDPAVNGFGDLNDPQAGGELAYIQLTE